MKGNIIDSITPVEGKHITLREFAEEILKLPEEDLNRKLVSYDLDYDSYYLLEYKGLDNFSNPWDDSITFEENLRCCENHESLGKEKAKYEIIQNAAVLSFGINY